MNIPEYLKLAKKVMNEDAGSEGMRYILEAKSGLSKIENEVFTIDEIVTENGNQLGTVDFSFPHDYGFALQTLQEALKDIQIVGLRLVY